jgi:N-acetylglucosamine-6-phosphate deacetylase
MKTAIIDGKVITPFRMIETGSVVVENGKIIDIVEGNPPPSDRNTMIIDAARRFIAPGFIDMHTHGAGNAEVMEGTVEAIRTMCHTHARHGTTAILPTTPAARWEDIYRAVDAIRKAQPDSGGARILGVHLEGPYCSAAEKGAQNPSYIKNPDPEEYLKILDYWEGIKIMSAAPELDGGLQLGRELRKRGILAAIAHSNADYRQVVRALENGYTHVTHFYSGCSMTHRENAYRIAGVVESGYLLDELSVEIIADGRHLPPSLLKLIYKVKGAASTALVTDSTKFAGLPPQELKDIKTHDGMEIIYEDEVIKLKDRSCFAGSVATTNRLVRNMVRLADVPLLQAVEMASYTPARILGIDKHKGSLSVGKDADILLFDEDIDIAMTMVQGKLIYQREA